jgi:hypothetical protein
VWAVSYVVLFHQNGLQANPWPDPPDDGNRARTVADVRAVFERTARAIGVDGIPTDQGGPFADVYREDGWDGVSYGDWPEYRVTVGPRGALHIDRT